LRSLTNAGFLTLSAAAPLDNDMATMADRDGPGRHWSALRSEGNFAPDSGPGHGLRRGFSGAGESAERKARRGSSYGLGASIRSMVVRRRGPTLRAARRSDASAKPLIEKDSNFAALSEWALKNQAFP